MPKTLKEWKNFDEQLSRLKERGLIIDNETKALGYLKTIGYYRLVAISILFVKVIRAILK